MRDVLTDVFGAAAAVSIAQEVAPCGIRVCNLITGTFKTEVHNAINHDRARTIDEYTPVRDYLLQHIASQLPFVRGDPNKAAALVVDAVHGDGVAQGKTLPLRLPLGPDALNTVKDQCAFNMAACEEWGSVVTKTNFDGCQGT